MLMYYQLDFYLTTTFTEKNAVMNIVCAVSTILIWDQWVYNKKISEELEIS